MVPNPTVLVLGAGASRPYGYPSGRELRQKVIGALGSSDFIDLGFDSSECKAFHNALLYSDQPSVDAFLEHRPEFMEIGKQAIAYALLPYEHKNMWSTLGEEEKWYRHLLDQIDPGRLGAEGPNLSVITFNYDRSLEHYLFVSFANRYNLDDSRCLELVSRVPIIHVYGQLGYLPWQRHRNSESDQRPATDQPQFDNAVLPYKDAGSKPKKCHLETAAAGIRIMCEAEEPQEDEAFVKSYDLLGAAECVVFVGFGYHHANLQRLRIHHFRDTRTIIGTGLGVEAPERDVIHGKYRIKIDPNGRTAMRYLLEVGPLSERGAVVDYAY